MKRKEHPLLFKGDMIRALLAGTKTQTRRKITFHNSSVNGPTNHKVLWERLDFDKARTDPGPSPMGNSGPYLKVPTFDGDETHRVYPRIQAGDLVWARETFLAVGGVDIGPERARIVYRATNDGPDQWLSPSWTPSIFMPRWAARITRDVVAVRPERVQDISEKDALAEGISLRDCGVLVAGQLEMGTAGAAFQRLWDSINSKKAPWESNPLVWAYTFPTK